MLHRSPSRWEAWGILDPVHQFFCLHWTELLDAETPDTWQVRSCNVRSLLREVIDASRIAEKYDPYRGVVRSILDELFAVVQRDEVLTRHYPFISSYLEPWRKREISEQAAREVEGFALVLLGNLDGYWVDGVEFLLELLGSDETKGKKKLLYSVTMNVAVETVLRGHTPEYLRDAFISQVLRASEEPFLERVIWFFNDLGAGPAAFRCTFLTDGLRKSDQAGLPSDVVLNVGAPESVSTSAAQAFHRKTTAGALSLQITVEAADPIAAKHLAEKRAGEVFAAKNLFSVDERFLLHTSLVLVESSSGDAVLLEHQSTSHHLGSYRSRPLQADLLFRVHEQLLETSPPDASQLAASVEYHRLATLAASDEARLVNLWIAVEALCQGGDGSIIERVWSRIAPCVSVDNINKTLVSLAMYVRGLWRRWNHDEFLELFPGSTRERLDPSDLLAVLLLPDNEPRLAKLFELCSSHPLVMHRLFRTRTMTLDRAASVRGNLLFTRQNVEWQLKRVYRARNAIVHSGKANLPLAPLTQHLHCYLIKALQTILTELDRQPLWTIRNALEHRSRLFDHVVETFGDVQQEAISVEFLLRPEATLFAPTAPFAWPAAAPAVENAGAMPPPAPSLINGSDPK